MKQEEIAKIIEEGRLYEELDTRLDELAVLFSHTLAEKTWKTHTIDGVDYKATFTLELISVEDKPHEELRPPLSDS